MLYWSFHIGCFFLFKQKSAYETRISDWSSDVCSSDLILPPRFNRYAGGGEYGFHVDGAVMQLAEGEQLRSDLSCTLFLNDPGDYEGGRLIVSDTFGEHDIALPAGDDILYPSSSLHRVEDRKSVVSGKSVSVRVDLGGRRIIKKKTQQRNMRLNQLLYQNQNHKH